MTLGRSLSTAALSALMVASLAGPASAAQRDSDEYPAPVLLSSKNVDWVSGSSGWINLSWTSPVEVKDVKVTVTPRSDGLTIDYPENHDGFTSLFTDSDLSVNEVDFTSFKAETSSANNGTKWASVYVEYSLSDDALTTLIEDADGALWIGTFGGGLVRYEEGRFTLHEGVSGTEISTLAAPELAMVILDEHHVVQSHAIS